MILSQDNYFELLGVDEHATERDIRLAYTKMLRTYPHEQYPEEFQLLTEAKDTLLDSILRKKYVDSLKNGNLYDELMDKTIHLYQQGQLNLAYETVKRLLVETNQTDLEVLRIASVITEDLGYSSEQEQYIRILERNHADDIEIKRHLSGYYCRKESYVRAINYAQQVIALDSSDINETLYLIDLYRLNNQYTALKAFIKGYLTDHKELQLHEYPIIEKGLVNATNEDDYAFVKELVSRLKVLAKGSNKYEVIGFIVNRTSEIDEDRYIFKFFIELVEKLNQNEFTEYTEWVKDFKDYINPNISYFSLSGEQHQSLQKTKNEPGDGATSHTPAYSNSTYQETSEKKEGFVWRGSVVWAVIFALIAWGGSGNLGTGVAVFLIWYFLAGLIKGLMGCLVIFVVIGAIIAMFFG